MLTERQKIIVKIVREEEPITARDIAGRLNLTKSTIRPDLSILTMAGILDARPRVGYFFAGKDRLGILSEKAKSIKVKEVKSPPIFIEEDRSIYDTVVSMFLEDVGTIYVTNQGILSGLVSRKDLLRQIIGDRDLRDLPIGVIMTRMPNLYVVEDETSILEAAEKILEHEVDSLPVVEVIDEEEKKYKVTGRITKTTITRIFVDLTKNDLI